MRLPSGEQLELLRGEQRAVVTEVGATLRELSAGGVPVLWGFGAGERCSSGRGQVLAPWPNRLDGGRYCFGAHEAQAAIDEPERGCAIHGLVRWAPWRVVERGEDFARLCYDLPAQPGYPFQLHLALDYRLSAAGLEVRCLARNDGGEALPFGVGFHPYLDPGAGGLASSRLHVPATTEVPLDERGLPCGAPAVIAPGDTAARVTKPRGGTGSPAIGDVVLDACLSGLLAGSDGRWHATFEPPPSDAAAPRVELWADAAFAYCEVFTADTLPGPDHRRAVAVEPMTCPPDALRSGAGLLVLDPGESFDASWGLVRLA